MHMHAEQNLVFTARQILSTTPNRHMKALRLLMTLRMISINIITVFTYKTVIKQAPAEPYNNCAVCSWQPCLLY